ncbi:MAG: UDP-N-acetylglucosamine 2-epimerase [Desulfobacterales bacterium]|nr:UDP-N-acetylglucosamine 2-epimerase [Desulfobacterales bacterium]
MTRKIAIVTGSRAEYGLLFWLIKEVQDDSDLQLQLLVTGMHLSAEFGMTYQEIEEHGFHIDEKVEMLLSSDSPVGIAKSIGLGVIGFADAFERLNPDIVVVLGDRFEILAAAQAAMVARIPIAHLHGGEATEGLIDEPIRHAVTKMSHFHFVAAEPYRQRVIQLGESPERVLNYGALGLDSIRRHHLLSKEDLESAIDFKFGKVSFMVTYHPVTLNKKDITPAISNLLEALKKFPDVQIIFTKSNADTNGRIINQMIEDFVGQYPDRCAAYTSLGQLLYFSALQHVSAVIGNSSSGIIEVPVFRKPTVNIGDRQSGRLSAASIIDCHEDAQSIVEAIQKALSPSFSKVCQATKSVYGDGEASVKIKDYLKTAKLDNILKKKFYNLENLSCD